MALHLPANDPEEESQAAVWGFLWVLVGFKLATVGLIFYHMQTVETGIFLGATTWYWLPPLAVLLAGPILFRYRLRRVRAKREQLRRAEWMLPEAPATDRHRPRHGVHRP